MPESKPIAETCRLYIKTVYKGVQLDAVQKQEITRAYYAGALYWAEIIDAASKCLEESEGVELLSRFRNELKDFGQTVGATYVPKSRPHRN